MRETHRRRFAALLTRTPVFGNVGFDHKRVAYWAGFEVNQPFK